MFRPDGDTYHGGAFYNASPEIVDFIRRHPITPGRHSITARVALERRTIHIADLQADAEYKYALRDVDPGRRRASAQSPDPGETKSSAVKERGPKAASNSRGGGCHRGRLHMPRNGS